MKWCDQIAKGWDYIRVPRVLGCARYPTVQCASPLPVATSYWANFSVSLMSRRQHNWWVFLVLATSLQANVMCIILAWYGLFSHARNKCNKVLHHAKTTRIILARWRMILTPFASCIHPDFLSRPCKSIPVGRERCGTVRKALALSDVHWEWCSGMASVYYSGQCKFYGMLSDIECLGMYKSLIFIFYMTFTRILKPRHCERDDPLQCLGFCFPLNCVHSLPMSFKYYSNTLSHFIMWRLQKVHEVYLT